MSALLISTYDLGRQPFGLASPAAWLRRSGIDVVTRDLSRERLELSDIDRATRVAFYLPMHTATRLALPVIDRLRARRPELPLSAYGLYASLNEQLLRDHGVETIFGPEAEADLANWAGARRAQNGESVAVAEPSTTVKTWPLPRLTLIRPERTGLPSLQHYALLQMPDGSTRVAGATDASRGCKHRCRHCPIVPVYDGQFRVVPVDVVLADIDQQIAMGATHITFGDPDFLNGPTHARRIVEALHVHHPGVTYDATIKVEHLLRHRDFLTTLASTGCLFVTSAVESVDDDVLERLQKNHTRADFVDVVSLTRAAGVTLVPTFVAFTPWTTLDGYRDLLDTVSELDLVDHVAPVQWGLRLLVTNGSRLLELEEITRLVGPFDRKTLTYPWVHPDPRVDALQRSISCLVGVRASRSRRELFREVSELAGLERTTSALVARAAIPYLNEPWYC